MHWTVVISEYFIISLFCSFVFILGAAIGSKGTIKEYQQQAISNNFAHWEVNLSGEVTFKWNVQTNNVGKE